MVLLVLSFDRRVVTTDQALDQPVNRMTISQLLDIFCICFNMKRVMAIIGVAGLLRHKTALLGREKADQKVRGRP